MGDNRPDIYHKTYWGKMEENPIIKEHFIESIFDWDKLSPEERAYCQAADEEAKQAARHELGLD